MVSMVSMTKTKFQNSIWEILEIERLPRFYTGLELNTTHNTSRTRFEKIITPECRYVAVR